jgi:hypothetical protein
MGDAMKTKNFASVVILILLATGIAVAQGAGGGRGQGAGVSNYNPQTETTINGVVENVNQEQGRRGKSGTHIMLKTQNGVEEVHVGPTYFLTGQGLSFTKGESVEVTGSKTKVNGEDAFIARDVKKAGKSYVLRNSAGKPMWSGGNR